MNKATVAILGFLAATGTAQEAKPEKPAKRAAPIVAGKTIVDVESEEKIATLAIRGYARHARPTAKDVYVLNGRMIDTATRTVLTVAVREIVLRDIDGKERWTHEFDSGGPARPQLRLVSGGRVVVSDGRGGLLALHHKTGKTAWRSKDGPAQTFVVDQGLLVVTGATKKGPVLRALALRNGAVAFEAKLREPARKVAATAHGIAAAGEKSITVFDRFGPKLFELEHGAETIHATPSGWVAMHGDLITAYDRKGKKLWTTKRGKHKFLDHYQLAVTPSGDVLVVLHQPWSDSGAHCRMLSGRDGRERWSVQIPGLTVDHSKYRHDVYVRPRGAEIDIVSQGSQGAFFVVLDAATGRLLRRARVD